MSQCQDPNCLCHPPRTQTPATAVDPPTRVGWLRRTINGLTATRVRRRRMSEARRVAALQGVLRRLEGPATFHDDPRRDLVDCVARVGLAICRGGGDHLGDVASVHADFVRIVRLLEIK